MPFLQERWTAGVWNAQVSLREIRQRGYTGGYPILQDWLHPQRAAASAAAVRRFETPANRRKPIGATSAISTITVGYSRRLWAQAALDQKLGTLLRMHEAAFQKWGAYSMDFGR